MLERLVSDHETIIRNLRDAIDACSENFHDVGTADFLTGLMESHEQMVWMMRSFSEGEMVRPDGLSPNNKKSARVPALA